MIYTEKF